MILRETTELIYNVTGKTLPLRVLQGRASANPTVECYHVTESDEADARWSATATREAVDTTVSAAAGKSETNPREIQLADVSSITRGRLYLVAEESRQEWVEVTEILSDRVRVRHALQNDYSTSATFQSTYIDVTVDATWIADEQNIDDHATPYPEWRLRWPVTVGGTTETYYTWFRVVRVPSRLQVTLADLAARFPEVVHLIPPDEQGDRAQKVLDAAARRFRADLAQRGIGDTGVGESFLLDEALTLAALLTCAENGWHPKNIPAIDYLDYTERRYERFFEKEWGVQRQGPILRGAGGDAQDEADVDLLFVR